LAFATIVPALVVKEQYGRVSGLMQIGPAAARILSPLLAGMLLAIAPIQTLLVIDFATFLVPMAVLLLVSLPNPERSPSAQQEKKSLMREAMSGWGYIAQRPGLFGLMILFACISFTTGFCDVLFTPLLLGIASIKTVGTVASVGSFGSLLGSIIMS